MAEEIEENYADPTIKFPITTSLESCKTKFFGGDREGFRSEISNGKFVFYCATYKYSDDYEGRPLFVMNNLVNGFAKQLEDKRKYFFTVYRCQKNGDKYDITSYWITNCTLTMQEIIPEKYDDFSWTTLEPTEENYNNLVSMFFETEAENMVTAYLH